MPSPMLSDAELEAEPERERIEQQKLFEDHVLSMMESTKSHLPPSSRLRRPRLIRRKSRVALLVGGLLQRVGLRLQKILRRVLSKLYWTKGEG